MSWLKPHPLEPRGALTESSNLGQASCTNTTQLVTPSLKRLSNVWPKAAGPRFPLQVPWALSWHPLGMTSFYTLTKARRKAVPLRTVSCQEAILVPRELCCSQ